MHAHRILWLSAALCGASFAQNLDCNFQGYKDTSGIQAQMQGGSLILTWQGERGQQLRARFGMQQDGPVIRELAAKKNGSGWTRRSESSTSLRSLRPAGSGPSAGAFPPWTR